MTDSVSCFWFPDLDECQTPVDPVPVDPEVPVDPVGPNERPELQDDSDLVPIVGQIGFLTVALFNVTGIAMHKFRWMPSTYYDEWTNSGISGTNWWKLSNTINGYGMLAVWGLALIFQILSLFGVATDVNVLVWSLGLTYGHILIGAVNQILKYLGMRAGYQAWKTNEAGAADATIKAATEHIMEEIENEWLMETAVVAFSTAMLFFNEPHWLAAQHAAMQEKPEKVEEEPAVEEGETQPEALFGF